MYPHWRQPLFLPRVFLTLSIWVSQPKLTLLIISIGTIFKMFKVHFNLHFGNADIDEWGRARDQYVVFLQLCMSRVVYFPLKWSLW